MLTAKYPYLLIYFSNCGDYNHLDHNDTKNREVDPEWEHGDMVVGDRHKVKCKWCHKIMSDGIHRFKHLSHISGDAKGCPNVPTKMRKQMREIVLGKNTKKGKKKKYEERVDDGDSDDDGDDAER